MESSVHFSLNENNHHQKFMENLCKSLKFIIALLMIRKSEIIKKQTYQKVIYRFPWVMLFKNIDVNEKVNFV